MLHDKAMAQEKEASERLTQIDISGSKIPMVSFNHEAESKELIQYHSIPLKEIGLKTPQSHKLASSPQP